jgi:hypothetical protein
MERLLMPFAPHTAQLIDDTILMLIAGIDVGQSAK